MVAALPADGGTSRAGVSPPAPARTGAGRGADTGRRGRAPVVLLAVIGVALIVMPAAFQMFQRAPKGATMLAEFKPFMTTTRLDGFQRDIAVIGAGIDQVDIAAGPYLQSHGAIAQPVSAAYPSYGALARQWPAIDRKMTTLLDEVQANLGNYEAVKALPSFKLFPWFFVLPGILVLASAIGLLLRPTRRGFAVVLLVVGVGLAAAPAAFQMFSRGPDGARMMSAFKTIETTSNVTTIQDDFSTMASGQGAIRLDVVPALAHTGLSPAEIQARFPAVAALDASWVHILNDMTPMIGAMSDNVSSYEAIAALPSFTLFPWFFVLPGLLVAAGAIASWPRRGSAPIERRVQAGAAA